MDLNILWMIRTATMAGRIANRIKEGLAQWRGLPFLLSTYCTVSVTVFVAVIVPDAPVIVMV
jgi:hypothetical protein